MEDIDRLNSRDFRIDVEIPVDFRALAVFLDKPFISLLEVSAVKLYLS